MNAATITGIQLQQMVQHWMATPACAYLGSTYGHNLPSLLQQPLLGHGGADEVIAKLRQDIALLSALPPETIHIYGTEQGSQPAHLSLEIAGHPIPITTGTR